MAMADLAETEVVERKQLVFIDEGVSDPLAVTRRRERFPVDPCVASLATTGSTPNQELREVGELHRERDVL